MPRRRPLTGAQLAGLLALPAAEAEALARRLYGMVPAVRVTACLPRLTAGQASAPPSPTYTPACRPTPARGAHRDAGRCHQPRPDADGGCLPVASYRQLAWTAGWHLRRCPCAHPEAAEQWRNIRIEHSVGLIALIRRMI